MPARQFLSVLRSAKEKQHERTSWLLYEATFIAACAQMDKQGIEKIQNGYRKGFDESTKPQILPNEVAGAILMRMLGGSAHG